MLGRHRRRLLDACVTIVKEKQRPEAQRSQEWIDRQYGKIHASLDAMDKSLARTPIAWASTTAWPTSPGCALGYLDLRFAELDWRTGHPNLARLYDKLAQRQSFVDTVPQA